MKEILLVVCVVAVTAYLAVTAWEDFRTCEITRWKHLLGLIPATILLCTRMNTFSGIEFIIVLVFIALYVLAGYLGIYGVADGFVFAILTLFFGAVGGVAGIGIVIIIIIIAGFSFLINHLVTCMIRKKRLLQNVATAFVPHIFVGYIFAWIGLIMYAA